MMKKCMGAMTRSLVLAALCAVPLPSAQATVKGRLTLSGTFYAQGDGVWENNIFRGTIGRVRVSTRDLLFLVEDLLGITFPPRSSLEGYPDGNVYVVYQGQVLAEASPYVRFELGEDTEEHLFGGTYDDLTYRERSRIMFPISLRIQDPNNDTEFRMDGVAFESISATPRPEAMITVGGSIRAKLAGSGRIFGQYWLAEGRFGLKGRETLAVDEYIGE